MTALGQEATFEVAFFHSGCDLCGGYTGGRDMAVMAMLEILSF
ncbi:hypothetical protein CTATCC11996_22977 [Comamonas testosteroni ATCC 11996]|nr:hypothetical protein CTATCC11996_22977 [Comamonas testosteroni ATCC 11996]